MESSKEVLKCVLSGRGLAYLHNAVPVVARRDLEQGEEGHAKVLKCGVTTHALARVVCIANCRRGVEGCVKIEGQR